jgi:hypothetical protein
VSTPPPDDREPDSRDATTPGAEPPIDFDPYRFGRPEHPVPPEYAPPGYVPPPEEPRQPTEWAAYPPPPQQYGYPTQPVPPGYPGYGQHPPVQPPGQPGYPAPPGYPPPPPGYTYGVAKTGNTKATVAMVLGILSIFFCWLSVFDLLLIVPAIVLGAMARGDAKRYPERGGRGPATAGLVCALVAFVLAASLTVYAYRRIKPCIDDYGINSSSYNQCVHDKLLGGD